MSNIVQDFYPRPPRGGRRSPASALTRGRINFYPRPPRGGRRAALPSAECLENISIHALREEGDKTFVGSEKALKLFLSTPSARRATNPNACGEATFDISIHALREEGDLFENAITVRAFGFLSTPSARRATCGLAVWRRVRKDFYPRPPRGGRRMLISTVPKPIVFLSTPSARRATAGGLRQDRAPADFYPRPPRGGRPSSTALPRRQRRHFYPRPPRGGRRRVE